MPLSRGGEFERGGREAAAVLRIHPTRHAGTSTLGGNVTVQFTASEYAEYAAERAKRWEMEDA